MSADAYLQQILARETVDTGPSSPVRSVQARLMPSLQEWAGQYLRQVQPGPSWWPRARSRLG